VTGELRDWSVQETGKFKGTLQFRGHVSAGTGQFRGQVSSGAVQFKGQVSSGDR